MPVFRVDQLKGICTKILAAVGADKSEAETVAKFLVGANLAGHDSHGVIRVPQYVKRVKDGMMRPSAPFKIVRETTATALVDGNWGFGQVIGVRAMDLAIAKAKECGVGVVGVFHCNHIGRLADYPVIASGQNMIGLTVVNASPQVAAWGGRTKVLGTNPICVSIPTNGSPILLDMATSVVAEGKVRVRRNRGEETPEGWIMDKEGHPTTDPEALYAGGAILPFGGVVGYKGYGLSLVVEVLCGALTGAGCASSKEFKGGNGVIMGAIKIESFTPVDSFLGRVEDLVKSVRGSPLAPSACEILVPGEPELREEKRRRERGIVVEDRTWSEILGVAWDLSVEVESWMLPVAVGE